MDLKTTALGIILGAVLFCATILIEINDKLDVIIKSQTIIEMTMEEIGKILSRDLPCDQKISI